MEKWQRDCVTKELAYLVENIDCNIMLISFLTQCGILSNADADIIMTRGRSVGHLDRRKLLLDTLIGRIHGYESLARALFQTNQTGALIKVLKNIEQNLPDCNPFKICGIMLPRTRTLEHHFLFENVRLPLSEICGILNADELNKILTENISVSMFEQMLCNQDTLLTSSTIPNQVPYYIRQSIIANNEIKKAAFEELDSAVFAIEGISPFQLSTTIEDMPQNTSRGNTFSDKSSSQLRLRRLTARFILLESPDHFAELTKICRQPIYWLRFEEGKFTYIKGHGSQAIRNIKPYLSTNTTTYAKDEFLLKCLDATDKHPVLIFDSPGMGKTTLLSKLAYETKQRFPTNNVVFIRLQEMIDYLFLDQDRIGLHNIKTFLLKFLTEPNNAFGYQIQKALLNNPLYKVYLFLDGYDEVNLKKRNFTNEILQVINETFINARVFISTRPHLGDELEELFGVIGYKILPLQIIDQVAFLTKYWDKQHGIHSSNSLTELARKCLATFKSNIPKDERDIAGIPLQCRLVAELCSKFAKRENKYFSEEEFNLASMYEMYEKFLEHAFSGYDFDFVYNYHIEKAIDLIFPDEVTSHEWGLEIEHIYKIGVMEEESHCQPKFIHRTFADFLVAKYILNHFTLKKIAIITKRPLAEFLFTNVFKHVDETSRKNRSFSVLEREFLHTGIVYFLDSGIKHHSLFEFNKQNQIANELCDGYLFQKLVSCCLRNNLVNLFHCIPYLFFDLESFSIDFLSFENERLTNQVRHCEDKHKLSSLGNWEFLILQACKLAGIELLKTTCKLVEVITNKNFRELDFSMYRYSPTELAAYRGNFHMVKYLLLLGNNKFEHTAVHMCLEESFFNTEPVIAEKIEIINMLVKKNPYVVNSLNQDKLHPILVFRAHIKLIKCLVSHGADMSVRTIDQKNNIAHLAAMYFSPQQFHELIQIASQNNLLGIFKKLNKDLATPIQLALEYMDLQTETFEWLLAYTNDKFWINVNGCKYNHVLFHAVKYKRNIRVLQDILNVDPKAIKKDSLLCHSMLYSNVDAMKFFVSKGANLNQRCCRFYTQTLLAHILQCNFVDRTKLVHFLIDSGVDVNKVFLDKGNVLDNKLSFSFRFVSPLTFAIKEKLVIGVIKALKQRRAREQKIKCFVLTCLTKMFLAFIFWFLPIKTFFSR